MAEHATEVFVQIAGTDVWAGRLWSHQRHDSESATFAYAEDYLARPDAYQLDPALPLQTGQQQTRVGQELFGAFTDCAPDRWGVGSSTARNAPAATVAARGGAWPRSNTSP